MQLGQVEVLRQAAQLFLLQLVAGAPERGRRQQSFGLVRRNVLEQRGG